MRVVFVRVCVRACVRVCVRACVHAGESVIAGVLCFSVCQSDFALHDYVCVITYYYAIDFCVSIYAFHAFV